MRGEEECEEKALYGRADVLPKHLALRLQEIGSLQLRARTFRSQLNSVATMANYCP